MSSKRLAPISAALVLALAFPLAGCSKDGASTEKSSAGASGSSSPAATSKPTDAAKSTKPSADTKPTADAKPAAKAEDIKVDLVAILGTKKDGWSPKLIGGLKRGMKPDEAAKVFPGADKVSKFGFAEVPIEGQPGLDGLKLYFAKDKDGVPSELQSVKLQFSPALNNDTFWAELSKACIERYGKADDKELEKRLVTWVGPKSGMAQLVNGLTENHGFTLDVTLQR